MKKIAAAAAVLAASATAPAMANTISISIDTQIASIQGFEQTPFSVGDHFVFTAEFDTTVPAGPLPDLPVNIPPELAFLAPPFLPATSTGISWANGAQVRSSSVQGGFIADDFAPPFTLPFDTLVFGGLFTEIDFDFYFSTLQVLPSPLDPTGLINNNDPQNLNLFNDPNSELFIALTTLPGSFNDLGVCGDGVGLEFNLPVPGLTGCQIVFRAKAAPKPEIPVPGALPLFLAGAGLFGGRRVLGRRRSR